MSWYKFVKSNNDNLIEISPVLEFILNNIKKHGGYALIVGGAVRDALYGQIQGYRVTPKDIDIEVYKIQPDHLENVLKESYNELSKRLHASNGHVDSMGKSFGVIKFTDPTGVEQYDFSIPRIELKTGVGHKAFDAIPDPNISPEKASLRRDFTINAMSFDPLNNKLYDFHGGKNDLMHRKLKATSMAFVEDPLRVLRGMQFCARFGMTLDTTTKINNGLTTAEMCKLAGKEYDSLAKERICEEFMKMSVKGKFPGMGIEFLMDSGWIEYYPELKALFETEQDSEYHPEGNVGIHTVHVMNAAAEIADREGLDDDDRSVLILSAMLHDIAKPDTTAVINKKGIDRITSHGHEKAGGPKSKKFLDSIGIKKSIVNKVVPLIEHHLSHITAFRGKDDIRGVRQLAYQLYPATIKDLIYLIESDHSGRPPLPKQLPSQAQDLKELSNKENIYTKILGHKDLITGDDLLKFFKVPGAHFGDAQRYIYKLYLEGKINPEQAMEAFFDYARSSKINGNPASIITGKDISDIPNIYKKELISDAIRAQYNNELTIDNKSEWLEKNKIKYL